MVRNTGLKIRKLNVMIKTKIFFIASALLLLVVTTKCTRQATLPYKWLENFQEVDSGNRDLRTSVNVYGSKFNVKRTVRIKYKSTSIKTDTVVFKYDVNIISNSAPVRAPSNLLNIRADGFVVKFYSVEGINRRSMGNIPIKIQSDREWLDTREKYTGLLKLSKNIYKKLDSRISKKKVKVAFNHFMARSVERVYGFEL